MPEEGDGNNAAGAALSGGQRGRRVASSTVHPSLGLSQNTARARARAGIPNHIPIDFHAEKVCLFYLSLSFSLSLFLLHSLSSKPNPFGGAGSQKLSTLYIISLLPSASVRQSVRSLARSHMQHAFSLRSSRWMKFYTFRSRRRAISFARPPGTKKDIGTAIRG